DAASMAPRADGEATTDPERIVRPVEGLREEPATTRRPTTRPHLAHHRIPHGWRVRPFEIQLLHHRCPFAEGAPPHAKILGQDWAVPRANVRAVRTRRRMRRRLGDESARVDARAQPP